MKEDTFLLIFLLLFIAVYMVVATLIFQYLEFESELNLLEKYESLFRKFQTENNVSSALMSKIRTTHEHACKLGVSSSRGGNWDFVGSFYFVWTLMTTIGFGHAFPITFYGKLAVILFALTSIPIYVLLMNILLERCVTLLKNLLQKLYLILPSKCLFRKRETNVLPIGRILVLAGIFFIVFVGVAGLLFAYLENWSYFDSVYFTIVAVTTVGLGDYVPSQNPTRFNSHFVYRMLNWLLLMVGLIAAYVVFNLTATIWKHILLFVIGKFIPFTPCISITKDPSREDSALSCVASSTHSLHDDNFALGSFSAIQKAIDRIRSKHQNGEIAERSELKAVNTIEAILQNEYHKVAIRQGSDTTTKWRRAAARARIQALRKRSNVYNSMIDPDLSGIHSMRFEQGVNAVSSSPRLSTHFENTGIKEPMAVHQRNSSCTDTHRESPNMQIINLENNDSDISNTDAHVNNQIEVIETSSPLQQLNKNSSCMHFYKQESRDTYETTRNIFVNGTGMNKIETNNNTTDNNSILNEKVNQFPGHVHRQILHHDLCKTDNVSRDATDRGIGKEVGRERSNTVVMMRKIGKMSFPAERNTFL